MRRLPLSQTILSVAGVAILCGLGAWQVQRMHWKNDIIERLEQGYTTLANGTTPLTPYPRLDELAQEKQPMAIGKVRGRLLRDESLFLGPRSSKEGRNGYHLLVPLVLDNGATLVVDTGWVDDLWKDDTQDRLSGLPQETITVTGILRKPDWNSFTSRNSPANDMWFRADVNEIAQVKHLEKVYPFVLYATAANPPLHDIEATEEHWLPRNKHLQYAIFWFSMAVTLIGVYGFYWNSRKR